MGWLTATPFGQKYYIFFYFALYPAYTIGVVREEERMKCRDCNVEMIVSTGMVPVWGTLDDRPIQTGTTLNMVSASECPVMKCPECGHSVYFGETLYSEQK